MSKLAIGMIETMGLAAGIEAADICLKAANINLVGYEFAKGSGMTVIKIEGNVGAVKAAISAATAALGKLGKVHTKMVIPRPSDSIDMLIRNESTVGYEDKKEEIPQVKQNWSIPELQPVNLFPFAPYPAEKVGSNTGSQRHDREPATGRARGS